MFFSLEMLMETKHYSISLWRHSEPMSSAIIFKQGAFCLSQLSHIVIQNAH